MSALADAAARRRALDPAGSFIVQAPAGSGKTGLLIQRMLALLATVEQPEEVVAITFTRKATGEMRERVLEALASAGEPAPAGAGHLATTVDLARAVLARDRALGWGIERQPSRLRIVTIDALCGWLARQLVLRSGLAGDATVARDAAPLYAEAGLQMLSVIDDGSTPWTGAVARVLEHLDNDVERLQRLLVPMLARRDQWLRLLGAGRSGAGRTGVGQPAAGPGAGSGAGEAGTGHTGARESAAGEPGTKVGGAEARGAGRAALEAALGRAVGERLSRARATVPAGLARELVAVCAYAGEQLARSRPELPGAACAGLRALPGTDQTSLGAWQGIGSILLTGRGEPRIAHDVRNGFPPSEEGRAMKSRVAAVCAAIAEEPELRARLQDLRALPPARYTDAQWSVLESLLDALRLAAASLKVVFAERGAHDHLEVAGAARLALGAEEAPSDLALRLDHRIAHLLVDEFQDTSHGQFDLLHALTAGWAEGDGRTLFLVGDPMQSIYRFREADVGLFEHARRHGIGQVRLEPLALESNFRSRPAIVEWVNRHFPSILGGADDPTTGAVAYRASRPVRPVQAGSGPAGGGAGVGRASAGVEIHLHEGEPEAETRTVVELVRRALEDGDGSVAILVRARSHLGELLPALRAAGIAYRGVDVEPLAEVPAVRDLLALASAALDPLDRASWLACLRAPWCGLSLGDLHGLVAGAPAQVPVCELLADDARIGALGADAQDRLLRVREPLLGYAREARRGRLARGLEATWQRLAGPACVDPAGLAAAERLLALVHELEPQLLERGAAELSRQVADLFAEPAAADRAVDVMTMHKAKGLEFDTVILPGLARVPAADQRSLLAWTARADGPDAGDLLLAPLPAAGDDDRRLYEFVRRLEQGKAAHEVVRVLYVAATRARERLHLVATLDAGEEDEPCPHPRSLLALLWDGLAAGDRRVPSRSAARSTAHAALASAGTPGEGAAWPGPRRLPGCWAPPTPPANVAPLDEALLPEGDPARGIEFDWAGQLARHVGTVVHAALGEIARDGPSRWHRERLRGRRAALGARLRALGVAADDVEEGAQRVEEILAQTLADRRARWILDPAHRDAACELALAGTVDGVLVRGVIDRTFVDGDGTRWVIDYKSGTHEGGSVEAFLDRERGRYRAQLERYGALVAELHGEPVRLALYYPAIGGWREWGLQTRGRG